MNKQQYMKSILPEFILMLIATASLGYLFGTGFYAFEGIDYAEVLALVTCAVLLVVLYAIAYTKRTAIIGGVVLGVALVLIFVINLVANGMENVFEDDVGNVFLYETVIVLTCIGVFLLSRKRLLCILMVVGGIFAYGVMQYLYQEGHVVAFCLFLFSGAAVIMYRTYRLGLTGTITRRTAFVPTMVFTSIAALAALGISLGVFYFIVQPLDPPAQEIKLITEYKALEELPRRGVNEEMAITDPDMTSTVLNGEYMDSQEDETDQETETDPTGGSLSNSLQSAMQAIGSSLGQDDDSNNSLLDLITFNVPWYGWILIILLIVAIILAPIFIKRYTRKRFYEKAQALPPSEFVETLYLRFMRDFKRMGVKRGSQTTPYEFAYQTSHKLMGFANNEAYASFTRVSLAFVRCSFGGKEPTVADMNACSKFYESFYKNCRTFVGTPKYVRLYFRL